MLFIYCGDGKGKTTAAAGHAVRAAGAGEKVLFVQFMKDGTSSELSVLSGIGGIEVLSPIRKLSFYKYMTAGEKEEACAVHNRLIAEIRLKLEKNECGVVVLDEITSAYRYGLADRAAVEDLLRAKDKADLILTGRDPDPNWVGMADYVTEMKKIKHPFDRGIAARKGVEF